MSSKDIILQAIRAKNRGVSTQPRLPVALLSGGTWTFRQKGLTLKDVLDRPELGAPAILEINETVQSDIVWPGSGYHNILVHILGGKIKFRPQGNIDVLEPLLTTTREVDRLQPGRLNSHEWIAAIRSIISQVHSQIGDRVLVGTSSWGPFTLAGQFLGVEKLMTGLYKDKQGVHALLEAMTELCTVYLEPLIEQGAAIESIAEPTASGDLISLRHFEEFVAPYIGKVAKRLKDKGAYTTLHICGNIKNRLHLIPDLHVDLLSLDYKVDLATAQLILDGKTAVAGNVNPVLLKDAAPSQIAQTVKECIRQAGRAANYVLMPGCDIPAGVPLANVLAFIDAGRHSCTEVS
ncbi:MAG TPA: uroporphyrinogen decarboxylase family protein [Methylomusa anaerophila]|uniref:Uroporphyrinogen decarboxylase n=1 Tax=Methylomusa anaerophila TaxID=1930071 RepID=A0A348AQQ0_9FIRM|nr:uroporphyrinogen decarboxylase family protein [Methylomusa anaerophila]BBB93398.1 uroporphyrinogen decarboxylase [Methylomusa anaerophila]HML90346.1 uroporphyrinogen decarboxylase family protein [Methylomusa anaerophila]